MLLRLLLCCALVRWTDACMPMQPGELPCPSKPPTFKPPDKDGTLITYPFDKPMFSMGDTIYSCPYTMVSSKTDETPTDKWKIVCRPNSGFFSLVIDGKDQGMIKDGIQYGCSEKKCPIIPPLESAEQTPAGYTKGGPIKEVDGADGKKVAGCPPDQALYLIGAAPPPTLVKEEDKPACKRDSGMWSPMEMKYMCLSTTCKAVKLAGTTAEACPPLHECDPAMMDVNDLDKFTCKQPLKVGYAEAIETPKVVDMLVCDKGTGKWKGAGNDLIDVPTVNCAKDIMCTTCTPPTLLAKDSAPCMNPTGRYCSGVAMIKPDDTTKCSTIKCDTNDGFLSTITDNKIVNFDKVAICKEGKWMVGNAEEKFINGAVCSQKLDCNGCNTDVSTAYDNVGRVYTDDVTQPRDDYIGKTCTYTCTAAGSFPHAADMKVYDYVTCDAITKMPMFADGTALTNMWFCGPCGCAVGGGDCPPLWDCVDATIVGCTYECPPGTQASYKDTSGKLQKKPPGKYHCDGKTIPELMSYGSELKCLQAKNPGVETMPTDTTCTATILDPPKPLMVGAETVTGMFSNLRYKKTPNGLVAFCLTGALYSPDFRTVAEVPEMPCNGASWDYPKATCIDDKYGFIPGKACTTMFPSSEFDYKCDFGICKALCKAPKKLKIEVDNSGQEEDAEGGICWMGEFPVTYDDTTKVITKATCA